VNWDRLEGQWKQQRGQAERLWGKIMNDELSAILGKYEELVGKLQENYGIAKEDAKEQADDFKKTIEQLKKPNGKRTKLQKVLSKKKPRAIKVKSQTRSRTVTVTGKKRRLEE
jgi:uncharacterized protein YjbJ (UPF0337 family)